MAYVDQGYTGEQPAEKAEAHGIQLEVVKHPKAKKGFVLLPRRWVVERDFAWASRFRRLVKDYERLPETVAGLHFVAFACLMLHRAITTLGLERVMNSIRNGLGMRKAGSRRGPGQPANPHSNAVFTQVHNTL